MSKRKILNVASYLSMTAFGVVIGVCGLGDVPLLVFLFLTITSGLLLTAVSTLYTVEAHRELRTLDTLEARCRVLERWAKYIEDNIDKVPLPPEVDPKQVHEASTNIH